MGDANVIIIRVTARVQMITGDSPMHTTHTKIDS